MVTDRVLGEGHFEDNSTKPSGAATPVSGDVPVAPVGKGRRGRGGGVAGGRSKKAKTTKERLRLIDGDVD